MAFPDVAAIKRSVSQRSKLFRWRHLLLALLRTIALLLLLLCFLRPVLSKFGYEPGRMGKRHALIVLDHSLSMEHRSGLNTARAAGLQRAAEVVRGLKPGDLLNVIVAGARPTSAFFGFSDNHTEAIRFLEGLGPGMERGDINAANAFAARALAEVDGQVEIYYVSDFQRSNWGNTTFKELPDEARVFFLDVGREDRENVAILSTDYDAGALLAGEPLNIEVEIGNFSPDPLTTELEGVLDDSVSYTVEATANPWSITTVTLPILAPPPGIHRLELRLPKDDLEADNTHYVTLGVLDKEEILVVSDTSSDASTRALFLNAALNPYEGDRGSLLPRQVATFDLTPAELSGPRAVLLSGIEKPSSYLAEMIASYVKSGGGVVYFLDGPADNIGVQYLGESLGEGMLPFNLLGKQDAKTVAGGSLKIGRGEFRSRFLKLFVRERRAALAEIDFYDTWRAVPTGDAEVILSFDDGTPAMGVSYPGLGCLVLCNFSVDELSSNLARQRMFPAWVQELVKNLTSDVVREAGNEVGMDIDNEVWAMDLQGATGYLNPEGKPLRIKRQALGDGDRIRISFIPDRPGIYRLPKGGSGANGPIAEAHAVNVSPEESDLRAIPLAELPRRASATTPGGADGVAAAHFIEGGDALEHLQKGVPAFHWFLLGMILLLLFEALFFKYIQRQSH